MIVNFSVQNFGPIKDKQTLSFEADSSIHLEDQYIIRTKNGKRLLKLGLIYGANASGKTNVLKALDFLRNLVLKPEEKKTTALGIFPFMFDTNEFIPNSSLSIEFIQNNVRYVYEVELNIKSISNETLHYYSPSKAMVFSRTTNSEKQYSEVKFGSKFSIDKSAKKSLESNTLWNNTVLGGFLKTNVEIKQLREVIDWFENYLQPIILSDTKLDDYVTSEIKSNNILKKDVVRILKKADFNISDITIREEKIAFNENSINALRSLELPVSLIEKFISGPITYLELEHFVNGTNHSLPFSFESQGTQRYYGFAGLLALLIKKSVAMPIDELESSLHPDLFNHFLLSFLINSKSSQLIATTHNREILNNKDIFRNDSIWFANKNECGATELYSLADFDTGVIRDTTNVYNAYKTGKLGGVPNLGDYYIDLSDEK